MTTGHESTSKDVVTDVQVRLGQLLSRGLAGDADAYQDFLWRLAGYLRGYMRRRIWDHPDDVEDLVQETLLAVHLQRHTYDPERPFGPWMHAIARYKMVDAWRSRETRAYEVDMPEDGEDLFATPDAEDSLARRDLMKLLARLPEGQRLPIQYTRLGGMTVAEAARVTGMSEAAVKVAVHRGLKALCTLARKVRYANL
ncbi:MAG: sigma-70 family RNA polymerase sigma factor [Rubrivivax sp.]